ncbi:probable serine/threonine-protein kinase At1g01540 [Humulus lupulus]|uniref:probable serine/threonine-protein kinase At1g01540 n=1 Tax=Humulus lupulus TaxID=3486 RepID=UPI002B41053C|nr:probable serine/threonine-protein kinase At1g01540 [Humulus lupulus]
MAYIYANYLVFKFIVSTLVSITFSASVIDDLKNLNPPLDFNSTIINNCHNNPSLRYCSSSPMDLDEIFKFTIVGSHLCKESKNPNCVESFPKIDLQNRPMIAPLYLSFSFFWKYCPLDVLSVDLSNASLKGSFPMEVLHCTQIQALDLSFNELSGEFPVESFSPLTNLTVLNLSYNHFLERIVSETEFFKRFNASGFLHSGILPDHKMFGIKLMSMLVGFPIFVILVVGCLGWACLNRPDFLPRMLQSQHKFTPSMLKAATNGFCKKNLVGKSEAVNIYRGTLRDGTEVRIEIYISDDISRENYNKFINECKVLVQLRHKNILQVLGWCNNRRRFRAVVTEWVEGQNVEMLIECSNPPWKHRLRLMMGIVKGVCYLHENWPEVDYDLKASSVLLSSNLEPLISRFQIGEQKNSTRKIYKLGEFLLEIIVNKKLLEEFEGGETGLIDHIRMHYPGNLHKVLDEKMKLTENAFDQAKQIIGLGLMCTDQTSYKQLSLKQVFDIISRAYESVTVLVSPDQKRSHRDRDKESKRIQFR